MLGRAIRKELKKYRGKRERGRNRDAEEHTIGVSTINKSGRVHPSAWGACKGGTVVVSVLLSFFLLLFLPLVIMRVLMAQIKYDPISRCKPRNNGIDFISISPRKTKASPAWKGENEAAVQRDEEGGSHLGPGGRS